MLSIRGESCHKRLVRRVRNKTVILHSHHPSRLSRQTVGATHIYICAAGPTWTSSLAKMKTLGSELQYTCLKMLSYTKEGVKLQSRACASCVLSSHVQLLSMDRALAVH